jgi:predicted O-methyltransferase YrrM
MDHFYHKIKGKGFFDFADVYTAMVQRFPAGAHFVEIGSLYGCSAAFMAVEIYNSGKHIKLHCVDDWSFEDDDYSVSEEYKDKDTAFDQFLFNMRHFGNIVSYQKMKSVDAAKLYADQSLEFVYIDGSHQYEFFKTDLLSWYPKVKKGGVIAGHDRSFDGVYKAVHEYFCFCELQDVGNGSWLHYKN